jgi:hypothetical protein
MRTEAQEHRRIAERRERNAAAHFNRRAAGELRQVQLDGLHDSREICHDQNRLLLHSPHEDEDF